MGAMKKSHKIVLTFCLLLMTLVTQVSAVQARSLEEQREAVIELYMSGITQNYSYEEVERYIAQEEAYVLETGTFRSLSSYGMEGSRSTAQSIGLVEYLQNYFEANADANMLDDLYPYQVDFNQLPENMIFYEAGNTSVPAFYVSNDHGMLTIDATKTYQDGINGPVSTFSGAVQNTGTLDYEVMGADGKQRTVNVNTQMSVWTTAHRREFIFSFFINRDGGLSLLLWEQENQQSVLREYVALGTGTDSTVQNESTDWTLPHDWRMLSERRQDVPPVAWVLMSSGDDETIAFEPVIYREDVISGYMNPLYTFELWTETPNSGEKSPLMTGQPNSDGYFAFSHPNLKIIPRDFVKVNVFDENGYTVYQDALEVYEYRPTALAHDSGYLTLERYFLNQDYVEGYTYPYATVTITSTVGLGDGFWQTVQADANGYFYLAVRGHDYKFQTYAAGVSHPETGESIFVIPYPWTEWEYENAKW